MSIIGKVAGAILSLPLLLAFAAAPAVPALAQGAPQNKGSALLDQIRLETNENVTSIVSGNPNGGYLRIAYDIATVVDDGDELRVLPIVGMGAVGNIRDVLFLKGVDMGLANTVTLSHYKKNRTTWKVCQEADRLHHAPVRGRVPSAGPTGDQVAEGPGRQGGQLQRCRQRRPALRAVDVQGLRRQAHGGQHGQADAIER